MDEKRAVAGLWAVPGIGAAALAEVRRHYDLAALTDCLIGEWCEHAGLPTYALDRIPRGRTLGSLGDEVLEAAAKHQMKIAWRGQREYPDRIDEIRDAPPLLFYWGPGTAAPPRRRVAIVGTRHPDTACAEPLRQLTAQVVAQGIGVVSGAAYGIDSIAHLAAGQAGGETWGFLGSALDQLDRRPRQLWYDLRDHGATFWSELPPGVRAEPRTFPRRNRLISGASDAVLIYRANTDSGTRHTSDYANEQGRPVLGWPGDNSDPLAQLCLELVDEGKARLCRGVGGIMRAVGVTGYVAQIAPPVDAEPVDPATLSAAARKALAALSRTARSFDDLLEEVDMRSAELLAALFELGMARLAVEHDGRRYARV